MVCKNIHAKKNDIMTTPVQKDFLELKGFSYNESTFDDVFIKRWNLAPADDDSSQESDDEKNGKEQESEDDGGWGDELSSVVAANRAAAFEESGRAPETVHEEASCLARNEEVKDAESEQEELDFSMLDPRKIN